MTFYKTFLLALLFSASLYAASNTPSEEDPKLPELITPLARRQIAASTKEEIKTAYNNWQSNQSSVLLRLPGEMLTAILNSLDPHSLNTLSLVARDLRKFWVTYRRLFPVPLTDDLRAHIIAPDTCPYDIKTLCFIRTENLNPMDFSVLSQLPHLQTLVIRRERISLEAIKKLSQALQNLCNVPPLNMRKLHLIGNQISPREIKPLADTLLEKTSLTHLDLTNNQIGDEGARALARALMGISQGFDLNAVRSEDIQALIDPTGVDETVPGDSSFHSISPEEAGVSIRINTTLTNLNLSSNQIGDAGARALARALRDNTTLTNLNLSSNLFTIEAIEALAVIINIKPLRILDLSHNKINAQGINPLACAIRENKTLFELDLGCNPIGHECIEFLAEALTINRTLKNLSLYCNDLGPEGALKLADSLPRTSLTHLDLGSNKLGDEGTKPISDALEKNSTLRVLDLSYNSITAAGAKTISDGLKTNHTLRELDLMNNQIGAKGGKYLALCLGKRTSSLFMNLDHNSIGNEGIKAITAAFRENPNLSVNDGFRTIESALTT